MALGLSVRHFWHKYLLPALGFHSFLQILSKLPRIREWATSFSCFLTPASSVPSLGSQQRRCQSSSRESPALFILHPESC